MHNLRFKLLTSKTLFKIKHNAPLKGKNLKKNQDLKGVVNGK